MGFRHLGGVDSFLDCAHRRAGLELEVDVACPRIDLEGLIESLTPPCLNRLHNLLGRHIISSVKEGRHL